MKKFLAILVLAFLYSSNANAGVNEPGTGLIGGKCKGVFAWEHKKLKKIYLEKDKKINVVLYASCNADNYGFGIKKGKRKEDVENEKAFRDRGSGFNFCFTIICSRKIKRLIVRWYRK